MGLFDRVFGRNPSPPPTPPSSPDPDDEVAPVGPGAIQGPPEFVRAAGMQRAYWTHDPDEQGRLEARGPDDLAWPERLRLHHLICLGRLTPGPDAGAADEKCRASLRRLAAPDSPYRPRPALVWQGEAPPQGPREPDLQGEFLNPSITHLGCLEVYRLGPDGQPTGIDFVGFDDLAAVLFAPPKLIRAAKLFHEDGREEVVVVPLLYGLTWTLGNEYDRDGRMTRFVRHLAGGEADAAGASGLGVGQQDLAAAARAAGRPCSVWGRCRRCRSRWTCATRGSTRRRAAAGSTPPMFAGGWAERGDAAAGPGVMLWAGAVRPGPPGGSPARHPPPSPPRSEAPARPR